MQARLSLSRASALMLAVVTIGCDSGKMDRSETGELRIQGHYSALFHATPRIVAKLGSQQYEAISVGQGQFEILIPDTADGTELLSVSATESRSGQDFELVSIVDQLSTLRALSSRGVIDTSTTDWLRLTSISTAASIAADLASGPGAGFDEWRGQHVSNLQADYILHLATVLEMLLQGRIALQGNHSGTTEALTNVDAREVLLQEASGAGFLDARRQMLVNAGIPDSAFFEVNRSLVWTDSVANSEYTQYYLPSEGDSGELFDNSKFAFNNSSRSVQLHLTLTESELRFADRPFFSLPSVQPCPVDPDDQQSPMAQFQTPVSAYQQTPLLVLHDRLLVAQRMRYDVIYPDGECANQVDLLAEPLALFVFEFDQLPAPSFRIENDTFLALPIPDSLSQSAYASRSALFRFSADGGAQSIETVAPPRSYQWSYSTDGSLTLTSEGAPSLRYRLFRQLDAQLSELIAEFSGGGGGATASYYRSLGIAAQADTQFPAEVVGRYQQFPEHRTSHEYLINEFALDLNPDGTGSTIIRRVLANGETENSRIPDIGNWRLSNGRIEIRTTTDLATENPGCAPNADQCFVSSLRIWDLLAIDGPRHYFLETRYIDEDLARGANTDPEVLAYVSIRYYDKALTQE